MSWSLFNQKYQHMVTPLSIDEAKAVVRGIPPQTYEHWLAKDTNSSQWKPIREFALQLGLAPSDPSLKTIKLTDMTTTNASSTNASSPKKKKASLTNSGVRTLEIDDEPSVVFEIEKARKAERRDLPRISRQLQFEIHRNNKHFLTFTKDVSLTHLSIDEELPSWVTDPFKAKISYRNEEVEIIGYREANSDGAIIRLDEISSIELFRKWLLAA